MTTLRVGYGQRPADRTDGAFRATVSGASFSRIVFAAGRHAREPVYGGPTGRNRISVPSREPYTLARLTDDSNLFAAHTSYERHQLGVIAREKMAANIALRPVIAAMLLPSRQECMSTSRKLSKGPKPVGVKPVRAALNA